MHPECLFDSKWREDNLDTLPEWHPCFHTVHPELMQLAGQAIELFARYLEILKQNSDEPVEDLITHIEEEALTYLGNAILARTRSYPFLND